MKKQIKQDTEEHQRLSEITDGHTGWRRWGTYVADRAWGTVREDYSADGDAWGYFTHDQARSKAYRWGEDGIAGLCDRYQLIVFALAFWNGRDPILKERLFGLSNPEGNHGEDVKEYYFYLDATPTHSYSRFLYKYPQGEFPYQDLIDENARRGTDQPEYELLDTGIFDEDRYFDIEIEYAKVTTDDIVIRITATNRGPDPAPLHILPHLWFRNTWGWGPKPGKSAKIYLGRAEEGLPEPGHRRLDDRDALQRPAELPDRLAELLRPGGRHADVHRERDQPRAALRRPQHHALRQGRLPPPRHPRRGLPQARELRLEVGDPLPVRRDRARASPSPSASA